MAKQQAAAPEQELYNPAPMDQGAWDGINSPEHGGQHPILFINVGEIVGPLTYQGFTTMTLNGKQITVHLGSNVDNDIVRLPIAASFVRAADGAGLSKGDTFAIRRNEDVQKKNGIGAGNMMEIYSIKVMNKAQVAAPAVA